MIQSLAPLQEHKLKKTLSSSNSTASFWSFFQSAAWKFCLWKLSPSFFWDCLGGPLQFCLTEPWKRFQKSKTVFVSVLIQRLRGDNLLTLPYLSCHTNTKLSWPFSSACLLTVCANSRLVSWPEQRIMGPSVMYIAAQFITVEYIL